MAKEIARQNTLKSLFARITLWFKFLRPLVMMQLKDKIDFSFLKNRKKTLFKIIWTLIGFVVTTVAIYLVFSLIVKFGLFSFIQTLNFRAFLILMTIIIILSTLSCLVNVTSTLYFAKDNSVLLTMPVKSSTIFSSKIIVCFIYELIKNYTFVWPFLIAYGLVMKLSFVYFLWSIVAMLILTTLIVTICSLLSIPAMALTILAKKFRTLEIVVVTVLVAGLVWGVVEAINAIPTDIDLVRDWGRIFWQMQDFLNGFAGAFVVFDYLLQFLTGMQYYSFSFNLGTSANLITFGVIFGTILLCYLLTYLLSKPLFLRMASNPFEFKKKVTNKQKRSHKKSPFVSSVVQQSKRTFRTPGIIYGILATAIIAPIAILLQNRIFGAMDTRLGGMYMALAFNMLIVLLMIMSTNNALASVFSREGNASYLNKIHPVPYRVPLTGKLVLNMAICIVSLCVSVGVMNIFVPMGTGNAIMLALGMCFIYLAHLLWSAEMDLMNPQNREYQTTGKSQKNPNEAKSTIYCFIMAGLYSFVMYFLISENFAKMFPKIMLIGAVVFAVRLYLYLTRIKLYYKEK